MEELPPKTETSAKQFGPEEISAWKELLLKLKKSAHAGPFLYPVDPQILNIPDYHDKIKNPMDLSTVSKKLENSLYKTSQDVKKDIELMLSNCYVYNQPDTAVYKMGQALEKYFKQLQQKNTLDKKRKTEGESEKKKGKVKSSLTEEEHAKCLETLNEIVKAKYRKINWPFLEPVDEALVPNYYTLITSPMDLSTMRSKLLSHQYATMEEFLSDFELLVNNCHTFNAEGTEVYLCATKLNTQFRQILDQKKKKPVEDTSTRISVLKGLIAQYEAELRKLEKKTGSGPADFGYEEKLKLKRRVDSLAAHKLKDVVAYIQQNIPNAVTTELDELEINLDTLDQQTLSKLSDIVREAYVEEQRLESDSSSE
ncbi:hypothetical protein NEMIN01_0721 [Nematocida minor]|uniref:uncharacterized protein n=1 Tax=Nematocida minor TaxID=1912983 RepID=UPI00221FF576|nr:uncharacterized protein NEMIN01_0721 [Nematocida minor]KAI5189858.1 hypothetical protein NEMIN01_0721 [Nematocida minor]